MQGWRDFWRMSMDDEDTLASLVNVLETALSDVRNATHLGERLDGRTLCSATSALRVLAGALTETLAIADAGFLAAIADTHGDSC